MELTKREITKIAREVNLFVSRVMKDTGVGVAEYDLIHAVRHKPGITQAEACEILGADKGAIARQASSLEEKGYITREDNPDDGRSKRLFPTDKANSLKVSRARAEARFYKWLLTALTPDEQNELARMLEILHERVKEEKANNFAEVKKVVLMDSEDTL